MKSLISLIILSVLFSCGESDSTTDNKIKASQPDETLSSEKKEPLKSDESAEPETIEYDTIRAPKSGTIDWISGSGKARKGKTLFSYDNYERFDNLSKKKSNFRLSMDSLVDNASSELDIVKRKWSSFRNSLRTDTLLPQFPKMQFREEGMYYGKSRITKAFNEIAELENNMKADFVSAKYQYKKLKWKVKKGQTVKRGQIVAIAEK